MSWVISKDKITKKCRKEEKFLSHRELTFMALLTRNLLKGSVNLMDKDGPKYRIEDLEQYHLGISESC